MLPQYEGFFPPAIQRYFEPFIGGGAVFFHLWNTARLNGEVYLFDHSQELIDAYQVVRDQVEELIALLWQHQTLHSREYYYRIRHLDRERMNLSQVERAARTIYLNKTCYNGLFRVNRKGQFNVPMGRYKNPRILDAEALYAASLALRETHLEVRNFQSAVELGKPGDFFYFDPPYDPVSKTASFTGYTPGSFGADDQKQLARVYARLSEKGCLCMLSNSDTPYIRSLYRGFRIETILANRAINSNSRKRGEIREVLILNYE